MIPAHFKMNVETGKITYWKIQYLSQDHSDKPRKHVKTISYFIVNKFFCGAIFFQFLTTYFHICDFISEWVICYTCTT